MRSCVVIVAILIILGLYVDANTFIGLIAGALILIGAVQILHNVYMHI